MKCIFSTFVYGRVINLNQYSSLLLPSTIRAIRRLSEDMKWPNKTATTSEDTIPGTYSENPTLRPSLPKEQLPVVATNAGKNSFKQYQPFDHSKLR